MSENKDYSEENVVNATANKARGLRQLTGSDNQIAWAETIRFKIFAKLDAAKPKKEFLEDKEMLGMFEAGVSFVRTELENKTSAKWWIENRETNVIRTLFNQAPAVVAVVEAKKAKIEAEKQEITDKIRETLDSIPESVVDTLKANEAIIYTCANGSEVEISSGYGNRIEITTINGDSEISYNKKQFHSWVHTHTADVNNRLTQYWLPKQKNKFTNFRPVEMSDINKNDRDYWTIRVKASDGRYATVASMEQGKEWHVESVNNETIPSIYETSVLHIVDFINTGLAKDNSFEDISFEDIKDEDIGL